jgi:putative transcriptional regulator
VTAATLKGKLLVALPVLRDPNFDRTVVFVLEHSDGGAAGVVLNRPSPLSVAEPLADWMALASSPSVVFFGGPVEKNGVIGLAESGSHLTTVDLELGPDALDDPIGSVRVFAGYAGWGPGQLEDEIGAGAWLVVAAAAGDVMSEDPENLWVEVLRRQEGRLAAVAAFPRDPTLN